MQSLSIREQLTCEFIFENTKVSPSGVPYRNGLGKDSQGKRHVWLADARDFDLDRLHLLQGLVINVLVGENGLKLKPLDLQPKETFEVFISRLEAGGQLNLDAEEQVLVSTREEEPSPVQQAETDEVPAFIGNCAHPVVAAFNAIISYTAQTSIKEGIPVVVPCFIPPQLL